MVITKDLSRLGRDYILTGYYIEKYFPEKRVRYIALLDGIDTESKNLENDITPFKSVFNDMYAKDISNKIKSVKHNKQNLGLFIGGKAPFGYKLDKNYPNKLFIDENVKHIIKRIFNEACLGNSCRNIANNLNLDNIPTPSQYAASQCLRTSKISNLWSDSRIREILLNEVYIGNMVQGRMRKLSYKSKKNIRLPKKEWKIIKNTHKPIIDLKTFLKAQEMINLRKQTRVKSHDYLLKGLIYCHECGKKMGCTSRQLACGNVYYFRCNTYISYGKLGYCFPHSARMDFIENLVTKKLLTLINKFYDKNKFINLIRKTIQNQKQNNLLKNNFCIYTNQINKISVEIDNLYNDKLSGLISSDDFSRIYKAKKSKQNKLKENLENLNSINQISNTEKYIGKLANKFESNLKINRKILTNFISRIEVDLNKKIYVYFKFAKIE